jgi:protease I
MATVPKCRFDLEVCGGVFVDQPCVVDGNLVSGRTYRDHGHYVGRWIRMLEEARDAAAAPSISRRSKKREPADAPKKSRRS